MKFGLKVKVYVFLFSTIFLKFEIETAKITYSLSILHNVSFSIKFDYFMEF